jgi:hypothetical protein
MIRKMIDCQKKFTINDMAIEVMDGGTKPKILGNLKFVLLADALYS